METTPLEALIVKPDEVLVLRLREDVGDSFITEVLLWAEEAGLKGRVAVFTGEVEMAVIQSESRDGLRG